MQEHSMLKIGEFARLGQISIATLHYYDQYGLLKPGALDPNTSYRYYALDQLARLHRILALKDLGFPLEQIAQLLADDLSLEQLQGMFRLKQAQTQQMIEIEQARLTRIATRLRQIEQEGKMPTYEVLLKQVDALLIASIREPIPMGDDIERSHKKIRAFLHEQQLQSSQPALLLFHSRYELHDDVMEIDVEAAVPLPVMLPDNEQVKIRTLPADLMACTVHTGDMLSIGRAHLALHRWVNENGYQLAAPPRQIYLQHGEEMDPRQYITELQFPVRRNNAHNN
jgi:DNA-binding transcriptional MerR regulator